MCLQMRPFCLLGAMRLRPGTLTSHTWTTSPLPSPCTPTRSSTLAEAVFLCFVASFGNFDHPFVFFLLEKPWLWWTSLVLVLVLYAWLSATRMRAVSNASMSMALRQFVFAAPTSIFGWHCLCAGQLDTRSTGSYFRCLSCYGRRSCACSLCSKHRSACQECGALFLCPEQVFPPHSYLAEAQLYSDAQDGRHTSQSCARCKWMSLS